MFSIIYCFEAVTLATAIFGAEATTTVTRRVFAYVSAVGFGLSFLSGGYVMGRTAQLIQHDNAIGQAPSADHDHIDAPFSEFQEPKEQHKEEQLK